MASSEDEHFEDTDCLPLVESELQVKHILGQLKETVRMVQEIVPMVKEKDELKQFIGTLGALGKENLSKIETSPVKQISEQGNSGAFHGSPDRRATQRYSPYTTPQKSGLGLGEIVFTAKSCFS